MLGAMFGRKRAPNEGAEWVKNAEHAACAVPDCFRDDPSVVHVFLNGGRTFFGVERMKPAQFSYGFGEVARVNACVERMPPRLGDADVGITSEQWFKCATALCAWLASVCFRLAAKLSV